MESCHGVSSRSHISGPEVTARDLNHRIGQPNRGGPPAYKLLGKVPKCCQKLLLYTS